MSTNTDEREHTLPPFDEQWISSEKRGFTATGLLIGCVLIFVAAVGCSVLIALH